MKINLYECEREWFQRFPRFPNREVGIPRKIHIEQSGEEEMK